MTVQKFYPDMHPETTSVDGYVQRGGIQQTWAEIWGGAGQDHLDNVATEPVYIYAGSSSNMWLYLLRTIFLFDTTSIPSGATISSAKVSLHLYLKTDGLLILPAANIFASNPASNNDLINADYQCLGTVPFSSEIGYNDWAEETRHDFPLNANGLAAINKGGITKLGLRESKYDAPNITPAWVKDKFSYFYIYAAEKGGDYRPYLEVTFSTAIAVITNAATSTTQTGATLNGSLTNDGGAACTCSFEYGLTDAYGNTATATGTYTSGQTFLKAITGLTPGTLYHFRAKADNGTTIGYGDKLTFTTTGESYPTEAITRVSSLVHRYSRGDRSYSLEVFLGGLTSEGALPRISRHPEPTIPYQPVAPVCPVGTMLAWSRQRGYYCIPIGELPPGE